MDFTAMDAFVVATVALVMASLSAMAVVKIQPNIARWGYSKVIGWFRG